MSQHYADDNTPVRFTIPGTGKANRGIRHRAVETKDGRVYSQGYKPKEGEQFIANVRAIAAAAMGNRMPIAGPVRLRFRVFVDIPKSMSKRHRALVLSGQLFPCKTPDIDNSLKLVQDGLNQCVVADDKQVVRFTDDTGRYYGRWARIEVEVIPLTFCPIQAAEFAIDASAAFAPPATSPGLDLFTVPA